MTSNIKDNKSILNEYCQASWKSSAKYSSVTLVKDGKTFFQATVVLPNGQKFSATAEKNKAAESEAARLANKSIEHATANGNVDAAISVSNVAVAKVSAPAPAAAASAAEIPPNQNHLVLVKMLDIFRQALLRPLRGVLLAQFGNGWLAHVKKQKLPEAIRGRIDEKMLAWDVPSVCAVAALLCKDVGGRQFGLLLKKIRNSGRNRVAHMSERDELEIRKWSVCKKLISSTLEFLELWNDAFPDNQVDRHFIRQLRDVAGGASASLIEPPTIEHNDLTFDSELATGGAASIHSATFRGDPVAVKRFSPTSTEAIDHAIRKEVRTMFWLNHANIIRVHGACFDARNKQWMIVMELATTSLAVALACPQRTDLWLRLRWAREVAAAMRHCHAHKPTVLHLDLKSPNILLVGDGDAQFAKVTDFGSARILEDASKAIVATSLHITELWAAPEVIRSKKISTQADVFSFGVVLWELLQGTGDLPYRTVRSSSHHDLLQMIVDNRVRLDPIDFAAAPAPIVALMRACTEFDAKARPSFDEIYRTLQKHSDELAFVFRFRAPSTRLRKHLMAPAVDDDQIAEVAFVRQRTSGESSLIVVPQFRFRDRDDATRRLHELVETLEAVVDDDDDDDDNDPLFGQCTVEEMERCAFLNKGWS